MRIKFIKDHKVQQHDGNGPQYRAGEEHDFVGPVARTYALKYIARGYAEEVPSDGGIVVPEPLVPLVREVAEGRAVLTAKGLEPVAGEQEAEQVGPAAENEAPRRGRRAR